MVKALLLQIEGTIGFAVVLVWAFGMTLLWAVTFLQKRRTCQRLNAEIDSIRLDPMVKRLQVHKQIDLAEDRYNDGIKKLAANLIDLRNGMDSQQSKKRLRVIRDNACETLSTECVPAYTRYLKYRLMLDKDESILVATEKAIPEFRAWHRWLSILNDHKYFEQDSESSVPLKLKRRDIPDLINVSNKISDQTVKKLFTEALRDLIDDGFVINHDL